MTIGDYLVSVRKKAGLSQGRLALLAGVSQSTLSDIEKNGRDPSISTFVSICKALNVSPSKSLSVILDDEDMLLEKAIDPFYNRSLSKDELAILSSLVALMPSQQKTASRVLAKINGVAAAGSPVFSVDYDDDEYITISPKYMDNSRFLVVKAKGTSMQPDIMDGDFIVVQRYLKPHEGDIALVHLSVSNGYDEYAIKRYFASNDTVKLVSINSEFDPIFAKKKDIVSAEKVIDVIHSTQ